MPVVERGTCGRQQTAKQTAKEPCVDRESYEMRGFIWTCSALTADPWRQPVLLGIAKSQSLDPTTDSSRRDLLFVAYMFVVEGD